MRVVGGMVSVLELCYKLLFKFWVFVKFRIAMQQQITQSPPSAVFDAVMIINVERYGHLVLTAQSKATSAPTVPSLFAYCILHHDTTPQERPLTCLLHSSLLEQSKHSPLGRSIALWSAILSYHDLISCTLNKKKREVGSCSWIM